MRLGHFIVTNELDRNPPVYSGPEDKVTGNVVLQFLPPHTRDGPTSRELFGPLKLRVTFNGVFRTDVDSPSGSTLRRNSDRPDVDHRQLFHKEVLVHEGPFRLAAGIKRRLYFATFFPEHASLTQTETGIEIDESYLSGRHATEVPNETTIPLPPSLGHQLRNENTSWRVLIKYSIQVHAEMQGIDISLLNKEPIKILQYRPISKQPIDPLGTNMFEQSMAVSDRSLVLEELRPKGLLNKAKAAFKDGPTYAFHVVCTGIPKQISPGQSVSFQVHILTDNERNTATIIPRISIDECKMKIVAFTRLISLDQQSDGPPWIENAADVVERVGSSTGNLFFLEANDYTKTISSGPLLYLPCDFEIGRLSRSYTIRIDIRLLVGRQKVATRQEFPIKVLPPYVPTLTPTATTPPPRAGPSNTQYTDHEPPPAYSEARYVKDIDPQEKAGYMKLLW